MFGSSKDALKAALQTIQRMLSAPVWTSQAGEDPRLLEMLQVHHLCPRLTCRFARASVPLNPTLSGSWTTATRHLCSL